MPKFSIIIPVYNTEKYLDKCLNSLLGQTFKDFEIVIVNDGSTDNSENIIKKYLSKNSNIKYIVQKNSGLSYTRNIGIRNSSGEYFLLLDSDDYIEKDLLFKLNQVIKNEDLIRFQTNIVIDDKKYSFNEQAFTNISGIEAFKIISNYKYVELACLYAFNREFYLNNNYEFSLGCYHEDFGLVPRIIIEAQHVTSIDYTGYNYVQRENSIMSNTNYEKERKKAFDMLIHYKFLMNTKVIDNTYKSFISNSVILKASKLKKNDYKKYISKLKEFNVFDNVLCDTFIRKIKRVIMKFNLKLYLRVIK